MYSEYFSSTVLAILPLTWCSHEGVADGCSDAGPADAAAAADRFVSEEWLLPGEASRLWVDWVGVRLEGRKKQGKS